MGGLTRVAALKYSARGIRVNAIGPGFIETAMTAPIRSQDASRDMLIASHPIGRLGQPEEIAHLALFLSSPAASFITGAYYVCLLYPSDAADDLPRVILCGPRLY